MAAAFPNMVAAAQYGPARSSVTLQRGIGNNKHDRMVIEPHILYPDARQPVLVIADHASAHVPPGVNLGIAADLLGTHIAVDLGVAEVAARLGFAAVLGSVSRLVIDFNREADHPGLIPRESDGQSIPGNQLDEPARAERIGRFWDPYHACVASEIAARRPHLLVSLHSFTPRLATRPREARPWHVGVLYNRDDRAARLAIPLLAAHKLCVGDQQPYAGTELNATMNRHGEANGIAYLGLEVRQDLISDEAGVNRMALMLASVINATAAALA